MKSKFLTSLVYLVCLLALLALPGEIAAVKAAPDADPVINKVYITDVRDGSFVVSWTTDVPSDGKVTWGTSTPPGTVETDSIASTTTHYVTFSGLTQNTDIYFEVSSGASVDNNGGLYYQVKTGTTLTPPGGSKTVWGYLYQPDGTTLVANAIVYLQLQDGDGLGSLAPSQWVSARTTSGGVWSYNLVNVRTENFSAFYNFTDGADKLRIVGQGGVAGSKGVEPNPWILTLPATYSYQVDVILTANPTVVKMVRYGAHPRSQDAQLAGFGILACCLAGGIWLSRRKK
jgi:hypothetical protein